MAYRKRRFKKRPRTHWSPAPACLSRVDGEAPVRAEVLANLYTPGAAVPSGTLAALPRELTAYYDDDGAAPAVEYPITELRRHRLTILRCVGMLRPIGVRCQTEAEPLAYTAATAEVRIAIYRGDAPDSDGDTSQYESASSTDSFDQPDLFQSTGLGNERIAFMRSFMLPGLSQYDILNSDFEGAFYNNADLWTEFAPGHTARNGQHYYGRLPWWNNAELSVLDLQSKRRVNVQSRMYLLQQVRTCVGNAAHPIDPQHWLGAQLYGASFARLLLGGAQ